MQIVNLGNDFRFSIPWPKTTLIQFIKSRVWLIDRSTHRVNPLLRFYFANFISWQLKMKQVFTWEKNYFLFQKITLFFENKQVFVQKYFLIKKKYIFSFTKLLFVVFYSQKYSSHKSILFSKVFYIEKYVLYLNA